jgi:hypothetical protein
MEMINKQPAEKFYAGVDFDEVLEDGETIITGSSTVTAHDGTNDVTAVLIESGSLSVSGGTLSARLQDGTAGVKYKVTFRAATSLGNLFEKDIRVSVQEI